MTTSAEPIIVVGYDGSPASEAAAYWAAAEAQLRNAKLRLVHVLALPVVSSPMGIKVALQTEPLRSAAERLLDDTCLRIRDEHPDLAIDVLIGAGRSAELLVVGSRGRGAFRGLLLGSTSRSLVHHAPCPIAVVR